MRYEVHCSSAPYENSSFLSLDEATDYCYSLSEEYGYVEVIQWVGKFRQCIVEYTWGS